MAYKTFAAIDVGSYELAMKIFEVSGKTGLKEIDHVMQRVELGTDTYNQGKISMKRVDELCEVLSGFRGIMKAYHVDAYKAYGTSAIRETENAAVILDMIRSRTGIEVAQISNSEQRFLDYKAIASKGELFERVIGKGTAIVDVGGGSTQISLFDKDKLVATQNLRLGLLRLRERILSMHIRHSGYEPLIKEQVDNQMEVMRRLFLSERKIDNIILVDDYLSAVMQREDLGFDNPGFLSGKECRRFLEKIRTRNRTQIAKYIGISEEKAFLLYISCEMVCRIMELLGSKMLWAPGVSLCDGIGYEYAEQNKMIRFDHDFEKDILACADNIGRRFLSNVPRAALMEQIALEIFDHTKKIHGLKNRERLLLQLAARLNDCGKYISMSNVGECSHSIIMANEIIGLSHMEREIVANVVKYNRVDFEYDAQMRAGTGLDSEAYLKVAKLTAILKVSNGLVRSYREKFNTIKVSLKDRELMILVDTPEDMTLELGLLGPRADFFEEIFHIRPVVRHKRTGMPQV
ncbi:MAG: exopolyphosphatase [Lachnospiraceae bacterium]|nr:exopolyphosphatase [Lachnospiraceae bacterium]